MNIALIGATGLIGRQLWPLLEEHHALLVLGRRPSGAAREKLGKIEEWPGLLAGEQVDVAVSTLGSTRKAAGSWEAFEAVDRHAVLDFASAARAAGATRYVLVSSSGANAASGSAYLRLKGEVEAAVAALGFARVDLVQPGLLLGKRDELRPAEAVGQWLAPLLNLALRGSLDRYAAIDGAVVARAIAALVKRCEPGLYHHTNRELRALALTERP